MVVFSETLVAMFVIVTLASRAAAPVESVTRPEIEPRNSWLAAGLPETVPGTTLDRQCGSAQQALHFAAQAVMSGTQDLVIAGGSAVHIDAIGLEADETRHRQSALGADPGFGGSVRRGEEYQGTRDREAGAPPMPPSLPYAVRDHWCTISKASFPERAGATRP